LGNCEGTNRNPNHYIVTNKKQDKYFIASFLYQSIVGIGAPSYYSQFDNRRSEPDFGYRNKEQNIIYMKNFENAYEYWIVDYNKASVLFRTNVSPYFDRPTCTTDGKWVIAESDNTLCVFNTDWFYKYL
jgi:hypothetical protein